MKIVPKSKPVLTSTVLELAPSPFVHPKTGEYWPENETAAYMLFKYLNENYIALIEPEGNPMPSFCYAQALGIHRIVWEAWMILLINHGYLHCHLHEVGKCFGPDAIQYNKTDGYYTESGHGGRWDDPRAKDPQSGMPRLIATYSLQEIEHMPFTDQGEDITLEITPYDPTTKEAREWDEYMPPSAFAPRYGSHPSDGWGSKSAYLFVDQFYEAQLNEYLWTYKEHRLYDDGRVFSPIHIECAVEKYKDLPDATEKRLSDIAEACIVELESEADRSPRPTFTHVGKPVAGRAKLPIKPPPKRR